MFNRVPSTISLTKRAHYSRLMEISFPTRPSIKPTALDYERKKSVNSMNVLSEINLESWGFHRDGQRLCNYNQKGSTFHYSQLDQELVKCSEIKNLITLPSHFLLSRLWRLCNCINVIQLHESTRLEKVERALNLNAQAALFQVLCLPHRLRRVEILWARKCDENLVLWRGAHAKGPRWWEHQPTLLMINKEAVEGNLISRPS